MTLATVELEDMEYTDYVECAKQLLPTLQVHVYSRVCMYMYMYMYVYILYVNVYMYNVHTVCSNSLKINSCIFRVDTYIPRECICIYTYM